MLCLATSAFASDQNNSDAIVSVGIERNIMKEHAGETESKLYSRSIYIKLAHQLSDKLSLAISRGVNYYTQISNKIGHETTLGLLYFPFLNHRPISISSQHLEWYSTQKHSYFIGVNGAHKTIPDQPGGYLGLETGIGYTYSFNANLAAAAYGVYSNFRGPESSTINKQGIYLSFSHML